MLRRNIRRALAMGLGLAALVVLAAPAAVRGVSQASAQTIEPVVSRPLNQGKTTEEDYHLSTERRAKAVEYSRTRYFLYFEGVALSCAIYLLIWLSGLGVAIRGWAGRVSSRHFLQTALFVPVFLIVVSLLEFPLDYFSGFVVERRFNLSNESFPAWLADWGKGVAITTVFTVFLIWVLYLIIRRCPKRWWFYFWLFTWPLTLAVILVQPLIIDPLFYRFKPLDQSHPQLVTRIESMLDRAGLAIPRERIYEMNASSKTKTVNAYVTGIGASKRLVIWDNTLNKLTPDETLLVVGHETGHYVLEHIPKVFVLVELVSLLFILLGYMAVEKIVAWHGRASGLEGVGDLASLPVLMLVLTLVSFLASPAICAISRHYEHQADQYGLELAYGVVADPNAADARSFQVLGEEDLEDPDPSPFIVFWLYTHPPLEARIRFALSYQPWAEGKPLELVRSSD